MPSKAEPDTRDYGRSKRASEQPVGKKEYFTSRQSEFNNRRRKVQNPGL